MIVVLAVIWAYFHWATEAVFLTPRNISNLLTQTSVTAVLAVGMLLVIVAGRIDLSVGSLLGFTGGIAAFAMTGFGSSLSAAVIAALAVGLAAGLLQGFLTAYVNIPAFIVTLGGLLAWRGAVKWLLGGNTVPVADETFRWIGNGDLPPAIGWALALMVIAVIVGAALIRKRESSPFDIISRTIVPVIAVIGFTGVMNVYQGVPVPVLLLVLVALAGSFLANSTVFGRYVYAIGGNAEASRLSGINVRRNLLAVFGLMGLLTAVASFIFTARVGSAAPDAGGLKELDAIAACVIGGASLMGGRGTVFGACLGALIMASLDNGMSLLNVRDFMQDIIKGAILVAAVGLDMMGGKRS